MMAPSHVQAEHRKIRLKVGDAMITAKLKEGPAARDFLSMLPLTLTMNDLYGREKFASLPRPISTDGKHTHTYAVGDIAYWPPGPDIAIYYHYDGEIIPDPGVIIIGKCGTGVEALRVPGSLKVIIELMN
jgi:hypothetical protein